MYSIQKNLKACETKNKDFKSYEVCIKRPKPICIRRACIVKRRDYVIFFGRKHMQLFSIK